MCLFIRRNIKSTPIPEYVDVYQPLFMLCTHSMRRAHLHAARDRTAIAQSAHMRLKSHRQREQSHVQMLRQTWHTLAYNNKYVYCAYCNSLPANARKYRNVTCKCRGPGAKTNDMLHVWQEEERITYRLTMTSLRFSGVSCFFGAGRNSECLDCAKPLSRSSSRASK